MDSTTATTSICRINRDRLLSSKPPQIGVNSSALFGLLMNSNCEPAELNAAIADHAVIVGKLIALANSAWSNPVRPITSFNEASLRLGIDIVRTVSIALTVGKAFAIKRSANFQLQRYWMGSVATAEMSANLAAASQLDVDSARAGGLLYNIGLLWLVDVLPNEVDAAIDASESAPDGRLDDYLIQYCGLGYREASRVLLLKWGLPEPVIVDHAELAPEVESGQVTLNQVVYVASFLARALLQGRQELPVADIETNIDSTVIQKVFDTQRSRLSTAGQVASVLTSA